jgi:hypothetical protein
LALAQEHIVSGIEFLLANSKYNFIVPCHSGNHARTTKQTYFSSENGHSLEYLMYLHLAAYFRGESRVKFIIPEGYHSYLKVYDQTLRFHHGHAVKYGGGVGGIFIPAYKAISAVEQSTRREPRRVRTLPSAQGRRELHLERLADWLQRVRAVDQSRLRTAPADSLPDRQETRPHVHVADSSEVGVAMRSRILNAIAFIVAFARSAIYAACGPVKPPARTATAAG